MRTDVSSFTPWALESTIQINRRSAALTESQRELLDAIWHSQWALDKVFLRRGLPHVIGRRPVNEVIDGVFERLLIETYEGSDKGYSLTMRGALFSSNGPVLLSSLLILMDLVKSMYEKDCATKLVPHEILTTSLGLSMENSLQLSTLLQCPSAHILPFHFAGRSIDRNEWCICLTDSVLELFLAESTVKYLDDVLLTILSDALGPNEPGKKIADDWVQTGSQCGPDFWPSESRHQISNFVTRERLATLRGLRHPDYDCTRLIIMCEELNDCATNGNAHAVSMLTRAVMDHVAPAFGLTSFQQVASNHSGGRSFKRSMERLDQHSRTVADRLLHMPMRQREVAPTMKEVDFSAEMEALLTEFCRLLKT